MEKDGGSRLLQMQARFQQRQREAKLVAMYEAQQAKAITRLTASSTSHHLDEEITTVHRQGKVRQMFEERRSKAGIDKSYPLQPLHGNTDRNAPARRAANAIAKSIDKKTVKSDVRPALKTVRKLKTETVTNGSGDVNHNTQPYPVSTMPAKNNNRHADKARVRPSGARDGVGDSTDSIDDETFPHNLAPPPSAGSAPSPPPRTNRPAAMEKKTTAAKPPTRSVRHAASSSTNIVNTSKQEHMEDNGPGARSESAGAPVPARESMLRTPQPPTAKSGVKSARAHSERSVGGATSGATSGSAAAAAGEPCAVCGRRFASDRLQKHEEICKKASAKKRKPYDALKHRLEGTEAQPFIKQIRKAPGKPVSQQSSKLSKPLNSTWRQKHEDFIRAIRAAKAAQAHVNAGGKLSDLPPPPPSENPDYVQCPHCQRRFNQAAAERHIPKCASYQYNKPKPQTKKR